ncbi:hypothetical protein BD408DRAFT_411852 [Parasitella parasitica]|nr:hypothetical protein BD408DRAFT_411852 [Parasitella parasitica]
MYLSSAEDALNYFTFLCLSKLAVGSNIWFSHFFSRSPQIASLKLYTRSSFPRHYLVPSQMILDLSLALLSW